MFAYYAMKRNEFFDFVMQEVKGKVSREKKSIYCRFRQLRNREDFCMRF